MSFVNDKKVIVISCAAGLAPVLSKELSDLGFEVSWQGDTIVETEGTLDDTMLLNLRLRTAQHVFYMLANFTAETPDDLQENMYKIPWEIYLNGEGTFSVDVFADTQCIRHNDFAVKLVGEVISYRMGEKTTLAIPRLVDKNSEDEDGAIVFLHWTGSDAAVYLDTTGISLGKREYRTNVDENSLSATVASAILLSAGLKRGDSVVNPMCGTGTMAIEAAWIATGRVPGLTRRYFSFMRIHGYDSTAWRKLRESAVKEICSEGVRVSATDINGALISGARENAENANVTNIINFDICDVLYTPIPESPFKGLIVCNPPAGSDGGDAEKYLPAYKALGELIRKNSTSWNGAIFSHTPDLIRRAGISAKDGPSFFSGGSEGSLLFVE